MKLDVKTSTGGAAGTVDVPDDLFGITPNTFVMHQVVTAQLAAARSGTHSTKTRAEVRGVAPSRGARRAPVAPVRVRSAPRTGAVVVWRTARSRATTASARPRR